MIIMSVDYGDKRTGVAFCDPGGTLASPHCVVTESYLPKLVDKLSVIAAQKGAEKIVVGMPVNMDGSRGFRCDECLELGRLLGEKTGLEIAYEDERLTTVIAHDVLSANNVRGKKRKQSVDAVAAVLILQSYLDKYKK